MWCFIPFLQTESPEAIEEAKELLEFLYENSAQELYLRDVLSNYTPQEVEKILYQMWEAPTGR